MYKKKTCQSDPHSRSLLWTTTDMGWLSLSFNFIFWSTHKSIQDHTHPRRGYEMRFTHICGGSCVCFYWYLFTPIVFAYYSRCVTTWCCWWWHVLYGACAWYGHSMSCFLWAVKTSRDVRGIHQIHTFVYS